MRRKLAMKPKRIEEGEGYLVVGGHAGRTNLPGRPRSIIIARVTSENKSGPLDPTPPAFRLERCVRLFVWDDEGRTRFFYFLTPSASGVAILTQITRLVCFLYGATTALWGGGCTLLKVCEKIDSWWHAKDCGSLEVTHGYGGRRLLSSTKL